MMGRMLPYILLYLSSVFISAVAQVLLKKSASRTYDSPIKEYLNPYVIVGYTTFFASTVLTMFEYCAL